MEYKNFKMEKALEKIIIFIKAIYLIKNAKNYFLDYLGKLKKNYIISLRGGLKIILRGGTTDRQIFNDIYLRKEYLFKKINKKSVVLDIGSHIGLFSLYLSKKVKKIICFEPSEENFKIFEKNIELNKIKNIELYNKAVYPSTNKVNLFTGSANHAGFSLVEKTNTFQEVETFHPKNVFKLNKNITVIKMDCEGSEFFIFPYLNFKFLEEIIFEYHLFNNEITDLNNIIQKLRAEGFNIKIKRYSNKLGIIYARK